MHYCFDARSAIDHFPGIGRYVSNLTREMAALLEPHEKLTLLIDGSQPLTWQLPGECEQVKLLETAVSIFSLSQQWQIWRLLQHHDVRVFHSPYYMMPYFFGIPTVVTIHDLIPLLFPQYYSAGTRFLSRIFNGLAVKRASVVFVDSETTRRDIQRIFSLAVAKTKVVPLAADPRFFHQSEAEIQRVRRAHDLPEKYLLYLGSNKPHKNLVRLVRAYARLLDLAGDPPPLVIAGPWDKRYEKVKQTVSDLKLQDSVRFLGPVPDADLPALYSGALIFVFPSVYEGFGLPVIEAMACGTAVVCANTSSLTEIGADSVVYFDPLDVEDIAQKVSHLLHDDMRRTELSGRGLARAGDFSWRKTATDTLHEYRQL